MGHISGPKCLVCIATLVTSLLPLTIWRYGIVDAGPFGQFVLFLPS